MKKKHPTYFPLSFYLKINNLRVKKNKEKKRRRDLFVFYCITETIIGYLLFIIIFLI